MAKLSVKTRKFIKKDLKRTLEKRKISKKVRQSKQIRERRKEVRSKALVNNDSAEQVEGSVDFDEDCGFDDSRLDVNEMMSDESDPEENESEASFDDVDREESNDLSKEQRKALVKKQIEDHKKELESLKKTDPEYYKYLAENDATLLNFLTGEESEDEASQEDKVSRIKWNKSDIAVWRSKLVDEHDLRCLKRVLLLYKNIALNKDDHLDNTDGSLLFGMVDLCIKVVPTVFDWHLLSKKDTKQKRTSEVYTQSSQWHKLRLLVKSFLTSTLNIIENVTDDRVICHILSYLFASTPYYIIFSPIMKKLSRLLCSMWISSNEKIVARSFLILISLCSSGNKNSVRVVLTTMYKAYLSIDGSCSKGSYIYNQNKETFMLRCFSDVCACDIPAAYRIVFISLKNQASHLRKSIIKGENDGHTNVYNWSTLRKIRLWVAFVSSYSETSQENITSKNKKFAQTIQTLIYPLVQISLGIVRLRSPCEYAPMHLHIFRYLLALMEKTNTYIPIAPHLLNILEAPFMQTSGKPSTIKVEDFKLKFKVNRDVAETEVYKKALVEEVSNLLIQYLALLSTSISFPEISAPIVAYAKNIIKNTKNTYTRNHLRVLIDKINSNSGFIEKKRMSVEFGPRDSLQVDKFSTGKDISSAPLIEYSKPFREMNSVPA